MKRFQIARLRNVLTGVLAGAAAFVGSAPARAQVPVGLNPLGLYIGGGVGESHVRNESLSGFVKNHTGWKALVGIRPVSFIGAEIEYADFGHPGVSGVTVAPGLAYNVDASQKATSLFGLVYWPLPLPFFDLYAKAGVSRLRSNFNATCVTPATCGANPSFSTETTDSRFAYGLGAQVKVYTLGVRAEYERIQSSANSPDLYSLIATWTF
jgi:hypothetical protein